MKQSILTGFVPALVCASLALSCSSSSGANANVGGTTAAITVANAEDVASSMTVTMSLIDMEELTSFDAYTVETTACAGGGSITAGFEFDAVPLNQVSTGDRFAVTIDNCMLGGVDMDGRMVIDFNTVDGDPDVDTAWEVDIDLTLDDLVVAAGAANATVAGSWSQNATFDDGDSTYSLSGEFTSAVTDGTTLFTAALSGIVLTCDYDELSDTAAYTIDGSFTSSDLAGSVTIETTAPLLVTGVDDHPSSGSVRIEGAAGSTLIVTAIDDVFVQLQVDTDGDGGFELEVITEWDELER